ncbi:MAG: anaerobic glycerol-3-phosphate dehydrogenase subunit C [Deltaproteobacteria bacterium]|jgi:glycerol-3-phosphate dehydrogenase subunit C|nr:anaerobic glycerol-3-phosphate dehydrogenase subunit C [Deltaproteobacteria bacterium]
MNPLLKTNFEACTKCAICTEYCPVSEAWPPFLGPKQSGPDGERQRLKDASFYDEVLKYCTNCKRCEVACPSSVRVGDVIALAREKYARGSFSPRNAILSHTDFVGSLATMAAPLVNFGANLKIVKFFLEKVLKIPAWRTFPSYSQGTFRNWFFDKGPSQKAFARRLSFFHGCFINYNNPSLGRDAVRLINALGLGVDLLESERCCGVPLVSSGFFKDAAANAAVNDQSIQKALLGAERVVVASSTCCMTLRDEYPDVLKLNNENWRKKVDLLPRYIYRLLEEGLSLKFKPTPMTVAYHTACHMEKLGWSAYSIELLKLIPELKIVLLPSSCCGVAGTYGFKLENSQISQKIGAPLFAEIAKSGADLVVTECETCKLQIEMSASVPCENPLTVLARALDDGSGGDASP